MEMSTSLSTRHGISFTAQLPLSSSVVMCNTCGAFTGSAAMGVGLTQEKGYMGGG